jgi:hypothetical protein
MDAEKVKQREIVEQLLHEYDRLLRARYKIHWVPKNYDVLNAYGLLKPPIVSGSARHLSVWESDAPRNQEWHIMLCMNDENGNETGRIEAINISTIDNDQANFSHHWNGVRGEIGKDCVRIGRRTFPITGYNDYVGNICWNLVTVTPEVGAEIMKWLKQLTAFQCEGGTVEFLERYRFECLGHCR